MNLRTYLRSALFGIVLAVLIGVAAPHAYAIECNPGCGVGQTCDTTKGVCTPPTAISPNPTTVTPPATTDTSGDLLVNPFKGITSLPQLLKAIISAMIELGSVVLVLALVWVGFSFVRAQGNPAALEKARSALIWTIIGGAILLGTQLISDVIQSTVQNLS